MAREYAGSGGRGRRLREGVGVVREVGNDWLMGGAGASAIKRGGLTGWLLLLGRPGIARPRVFFSFSVFYFSPFSFLFSLYSKLV